MVSKCASGGTKKILNKSAILIQFEINLFREEHFYGAVWLNLAGALEVNNVRRC